MSGNQSQIKKLLDADNNENIILYDENNNTLEFEQVALIPLVGKDNRKLVVHNENDETNEFEEVVILNKSDIYAIVKPHTKMDGFEEDEGVVIGIREIDGEESIYIVDDNEIIDQVYEEYYQLLREEGFDEE